MGATTAPTLRVAAGVPAGRASHRDLTFTRHLPATASAGTEPGRYNRPTEPAGTEPGRYSRPPAPARRLPEVRASAQLAVSRTSSSTLSAASAATRG